VVFSGAASFIERVGAARRPAESGGHMLDIVLIVATAGFFLAAGLYVLGCERL
jgi:hypothetical protein